ncbi:hypothetical protein [Rhizobium rhizogenes]|uniref:hypothetical protein n=1 Tax=Rhizobium rhizogenes TaxID=359 RepID=UPI0015747023|nr:hypothetical protein [Rhizobium rhizogenes]NTF92564.1 hypothetical protein [Rhizobium rhizogenes]NTG19356.1 hypothetical protein [Rhizobium rhizogenes]NTI99237.1 hypothetical protein [Rhizobium rhizogenes]
MKPPNANQTHARKNALFRVRFRDGATVTTTAANALHAEQKARRQRPGFVETVRIFKGNR